MTSFRPRVIPVLLIDGLGLVKTVRFDARTYLGDPVNTVRIFNDKGADELVLLDLNASVTGDGPPYDLLAEIASEAFMPLAYGGGITTIEQIRKVLAIGYEKVVINTAAHDQPSFIDEASRVFGRSTVVVSIDVKRPRLGPARVMAQGGRKRTGADPIAFAKEMAQRGCGEILLQAIDRDGTQAGFDLPLIESIARAVDIPVIAASGAGRLEHFGEAVAAGASAVAAGSMFVFNGKHRAVLISYPRDAQLDAVLRVAPRRSG